MRGHIIKEIREQRQLTITELGKRIGVSRSQMSRLEDGSRTLTADTLEKIANVLEVPIEIFFPDAAVKTITVDDENVVIIDTVHDRQFSDEEIKRFIEIGRRS